MADISSHTSLPSLSTTSVPSFTAPTNPSVKYEEFLYGLHLRHLMELLRDDLNDVVDPADVDNMKCSACLYHICVWTHERVSRLMREINDYNAAATKWNEVNVSHRLPLIARDNAPSVSDSGSTYFWRLLPSLSSDELNAENCAEIFFEMQSLITPFAFETAHFIFGR